MSGQRATLSYIALLTYVNCNLCHTLCFNFQWEEMDLEKATFFMVSMDFLVAEGCWRYQVSLLVFTRTWFNKWSSSIRSGRFEITWQWWKTDLNALVSYLVQVFPLNSASLTKGLLSLLAGRSIYRRKLILKGGLCERWLYIAVVWDILNG